MNMKSGNILVIIISSFIVTVAWIGFNLYNKHAHSTISEVLQMQIIPIPDHFDTEVIAELKTREKIEPLFQPVALESPTGETLPNENTATSSATPTPTKSGPTPTTSPSVTPSP